MTIYRIRSKVMKERGDRFETTDKARAEARLKLMHEGKCANADPDARIIAVQPR